MNLSCPSCDIEIKMSDLWHDDVNDAPRRFGLAWPRAYCPHCDIQVRSNLGSLTSYGLIAGLSIVLVGVYWFIEGPYSKALYFAGLILISVAVFIAFRFHRFGAVEPTQSDADAENTGAVATNRNP